MHHRLIGAVFALIAGLGLGTAQAAIATTADHALLMDAESGEVLWQKDAFTPMPPASMSKLMTIDLLFQRLKDGRMKLTDTLPVSERAWRERSGSKMFVRVGDRIAVEDLIRGIVIQSGNDACVVVAEAIGGTVEGFVAMMNKRAKELGLKQSHFVNPDGLPDPPGQMMSAFDLATLARHIIYTYPDLYHFFGEKDFVWSNIHQPNRNPLLFNTQGADGLKTGHIDVLRLRPRRSRQSATVSASSSSPTALHLRKGACRRGRAPDRDRLSRIPPLPALQARRQRCRSRGVRRQRQDRCADREGAGRHHAASGTRGPA